MKVVDFGAIVKFLQYPLGILRNQCEILARSGHSQVKVSFCQMTELNGDVQKSTPKIAHVQVKSTQGEIRQQTRLFALDHGGHPPPPSHRHFQCPYPTINTTRGTASSQLPALGLMAGAAP